MLFLNLALPDLNQHASTQQQKIQKNSVQQMKKSNTSSPKYTVKQLIKHENSKVNLLGSRNNSTGFLENKISMSSTNYNSSEGVLDVLDFKDPLVVSFSLIIVVYLTGFR